jgi:signal transduction histidine kinase
MPRHSSHPCPHRPPGARCFLAGLVSLLSFFWLAYAPPGAAAEPVSITITNLEQLQAAVGSGRSVIAAVRLEATVCEASQPEMGAVIVQDQTGVQLLELGESAPQVRPGEVIRIEASSCLLRQRDSGVQLSPAPVVDNDGHHALREAMGEVSLTAGWHPLRLEWFNGVLGSGLAVACEGPQFPRQNLPDSALAHHPVNAGQAGGGFTPGLQVTAYEGFWEQLPDFNWLPAVKTGVVPNFTLGFCPQPDDVGLCFNGYFKAPHPGTYKFQLFSDDGALLFIDANPPVIQVVGVTNPPAAVETVAGQPEARQRNRGWVWLAGRVSFITAKGRGLQFEIRSSTGTVQATLADATGVDPFRLLRARIRARGLGQSIATLDNQTILGRLLILGTNDVQILESPPETAPNPPVLTLAEQVQRLNREEAERQLPVRIRGVVTSASPNFFHFLTLQDDTRGLFVNYSSISNDPTPASGELWEAAGHTLPGDFAPVVVADTLKRLGVGRLPEPIRPAWNQLINGSLDVQWVEIHGVVTDVVSNQMTLLLPEGRVVMLMDLQRDGDLKPFLNCHVRIRGVLFAGWNRATHEVRPGRITMHNPAISMDSPAPADVFAAPLKTVTELLRFDVRGSAFPRFRVRGQVIYADASQVFLAQGKSGLRILPVENPHLQPGDLVEAAGYPDIVGQLPVLREAVMRQTGVAPLPVAPLVADADVEQGKADLARVRLRARLLGWHTESASFVLEMQFAGGLFVARLPQPAAELARLRTGSWLELTGVCVGQIPSRPAGREMDGFDLLLNSPGDVRVLSQPSWWTLPRLLGLVSVLVLGLGLASAWITQLRRQVEQRTRLLQREIRERESAERLRALEAERSRIARDLHDDLGSSLTEIGALAGAGARLSLPAEEKSAGLFRAISNKARSLIGALDVIVWAVDPEDNSLQSLADYLSGYAGEYLANSGVSCRFRIPVSLPEATLDGRTRHELFLAIKETLHNVVQHAQATEVEFQIELAGPGLEIVISDNGCGFVQRPGEGHGLKNLPARLAKLGGRYEVISGNGCGTQVKIQLPLQIPAVGRRDGDTTFVR